MSKHCNVQLPSKGICNINAKMALSFNKIFFEMNEADNGPSLHLPPSSHFQSLILPLRWMFIVIPKVKTKSIFLNWRKYIFFYKVISLLSTCRSFCRNSLFVLLPFSIALFPLYPLPHICSKDSLLSYLTLSRKIFHLFRGTELSVLQHSDQRLGGSFPKKTSWLWVSNIWIS